MAETHAQAGPHFAEIAKLDAVVDDFARAMKEKLRRKAEQGFRGWDDPTMYGDLRITIMSLVTHLFERDEPQEIDIANLAMMLWFQRERAPEDAEVKALCERIGYGAVMDSAARQWFLKDSAGALTVGPCAGLVRDAQ